MIFSFIWFVCSIVYKIIDALGNVEYTLQQLGVRDDVARFVGSPRGIDLVFTLSLGALVVSLVYHTNRYLKVQEPKPFYQTPENEFTASENDFTPKKEKETVEEPQKLKVKPVLQLINTAIVNVTVGND